MIWIRCQPAGKTDPPETFRLRNAQLFEQYKRKFIGRFVRIGFHAAHSDFRTTDLNCKVFLREVERAALSA